MEVVHESLRLCTLLVIEEVVEYLQKYETKRIWTRRWLLERSLGATSTIFEELRNFDPEEYRAVMRITPDQFEYLLNLISPKIQRQDTMMREAIPAKTKLEITLLFLATGTSYRVLSVFFRVSKSSISLMIPEVCDAISDALGDYMKIPNQEMWQNIQAGFNDRWNFPGCCGAIDGKHILIQAPPKAGSEFFNYKGAHSIVLLAVADHDYRFTFVDIGSYGRNADGGVFQMCSLYSHLENYSLLPEGGILVGDDAFPLKPYLMKPYTKFRSIEERIFNYRLSRARRIIENVFGILVSRFRIFRKAIQLALDTIIKIVQCACTLHNWLRTTLPNTYMPPGSVDFEDIVNSEVVVGQWRAQIAGLESIERTRTHNRPKKIAEHLRIKYTEYFSGEGAVQWQYNMI